MVFNILLRRDIQKRFEKAGLIFEFGIILFCFNFCFFSQIFWEKRNQYAEDYDVNSPTALFGNQTLVNPIRIRICKPQFTSVWMHVKVIIVTIREHPSKTPLLHQGQSQLDLPHLVRLSTARFLTCTLSHFLLLLRSTRCHNVCLSLYNPFFYPPFHYAYVVNLFLRKIGDWLHQSMRTSVLQSLFCCFCTGLFWVFGIFSHFDSFSFSS